MRRVRLRPAPRSRNPGTRVALRLVLALSAGAPLLAAGHRSHPPAVGRIEGQVLLSTAQTTRRPRFRIYTDPGPGARPPAHEADEMRDVVLYLQRADVAVDARGDLADIRQRDDQRVPHVTTVLHATTLDF